MTSHVYPMHTHEAWTLLIVDDGMIRYDLHRHEHGALDQAVTLLPPQVPHNGRAATSAGFRKRVVYLDLSHLPASLIGRRRRPARAVRPAAAAAHQPAAPRARPAGRGVRGGEPAGLRRRAAPVAPGRSRGARRRPAPAAGVAGRAARADRRPLPREGDAHGRRRRPCTPTRPTWSGSSAGQFGISPHQYLTSRRVDLARGLLLDGMPPSLAAAEAGFYDQSHLTRHFRRVLGTSPGRYARSGAAG